MYAYLASDIETLVNNPDFLPLVAIVMGCLTGIVAIICSAAAGVAKSRAREATKREIAAYVAEGTIEPDKAIAMLNAGRSACEIKGDSIKVT